MEGDGGEEGGQGEQVAGAQAFLRSGEAYDRFMGRYSRRLAPVFADSAALAAGAHVIDVGCGPGALTAELVARVGPGHVKAVDPSPPFVDACARSHPGVDVRVGRAEDLPFEDGAADAVLAQLVLHFVSDPDAVAAEFRRVLRPGGIAAACVWDSRQGMQLLRAFWDAAQEIDPDAPDEARMLRFGGPGEIAELWRASGFSDVRETTLEVASAYASFDELWASLLEGIGPAGAYCVGLDESERGRLREALWRRLGSPDGPFTLTAVARSASARRPG